MAGPCTSAVLKVPSCAAPQLKSEEHIQNTPTGTVAVAPTQTLKRSFKVARSSFLSGGSVFQAATASRRQRHSRRASGARAAVATEAPPMAGAITLEDGSKLEVSSNGATKDEKAYVELRISDGPLVNSNVLAHWGASKAGKSGWILPGVTPEGTRRHKNRALQSFFSKQGDVSVLKISLEGRFDAIEFTLKNEDTNTWYMNDDTNFRVEIPPSTAPVDPSIVVIPPELLSVQAYLRWERNGKQNYSPEQEKEEYEKGRLELQLEVANGDATVEELRMRLLGGGGSSGSSSEHESGSPDAVVEGPAVPEDLLSIQSYIRWERNGKQNYSPEQQEAECQEAKKELQKELSSGVSVEELRKRLTGGSQVTAPPPPPPRREYSQASINRKGRDFVSLINKFGKGGPVELPPPRDPTKFEKAAELFLEEAGGEVVSKKMHKFGEDQLMVVAIAEGESSKVYLASTIKGPLTLHYGFVKNKGGGWEGAGEALFEAGFAGDSSIQSTEVVFDSDKQQYAGLSFVINAGGNWYKDMGMDFYASAKAAAPVKDAGDGSGTAKALLDSIADQETEAQRSLMHRFNIGAGITAEASGQGELGLAAVLVWFRFMATRQLIWNKNYNVKPREISAAQDRMTDELKKIYEQQPHMRELVRMIMMTVGRGGEGDVGQRIRDEILVIQRVNDCKGGMMEEWHQKLHNNTSPDDVVICQALLDHIASDFDMDVYWRTLTSNGVSKQRLASYDRPIVSEPKLRADQKDGLMRDLANYMKSLKAVHSGADLESAVAKCMGYNQDATEDFMKSVEIHPIGGLSSELPSRLQFVLEHVEDKKIVPLLEGLLEARQELRSSLLNTHDRLKDIIFLDLALDSTVRTAVERSLETLGGVSAGELMYMVRLVVENLCLSSDVNEELVYCLKDWETATAACNEGASNWALRSKAVLDRTRLALADKSEHYHEILQPSAEYLGAKLNVDEWVVSIFTEEMVRSGTAASLSLLLNRLDPVLRSAADMGSWQVISPEPVKGFVEVVDDLGTVQDKVYTRPTIIVAGRVRGEEEIPDGVVGVLTADMPDILSHVSVRARNSKVCFATCFDEAILADLRGLDKKALQLSPSATADLSFSEISESEVAGAADGAVEDDVPEGLSIAKKTFGGKFAVVADEFEPTLVGAKSRNIAGLRGKLPDWINLPTSVALPFGSYDAALADPINKEVAAELGSLSKKLADGEFHLLPTIRETVLGLQAPEKLVSELKTAMTSSGMPWPADEGEERWQQAWTAIKKVWASKWNERAYFSTRKAKMDHSDLSMAVLVQEVVQADYAFVIHTTNPSTEDPTEIYAEVVKGLGETLVGAYSGRALSFIAKKSDINSPKVMGYPSKRVGLFIKQSIIFRSDSNGEDLEGYAGAGLYDSVPMDQEEERVVDYSTDALSLDLEFQKKVLTMIAKAGDEIEKALGSPQDIEGVIKNGELYVVQTRPQM